MFHQYRLLRAELSYKLCASRSGRSYIMLIYNGVPEITYKCQGQGQVRPGQQWPLHKNEEEEAFDKSSVDLFSDETHIIL